MGTTLTPGGFFGELALLREKTRSATVKCLDDCDMLLVAKEDFDRCVKADILRDSYDRMNFFQEYVAGFKDINPPPAIHPSYFFEHQVFKEGHRFLIEGATAEPTIWAIISGQVTWSRKGWQKGTRK